VLFHDAVYYCKSESRPPSHLFCLKKRLKDLFSRLFTFYDNNAPAVVAPTIQCTSSTMDQNPLMQKRPGKFKMNFLKWVLHYYLTYIIFEILSLTKEKLFFLKRRVTVKKGDDAKVPSESSPRPIYAAHGAIMIFHRSYFEAGGNFDYGAFLFGEEIFVAETARQFGLQIMFDPRLRVMHHTHTSTGMIRNRKNAGYAREAIAYCVDHFFRESKSTNINSAHISRLDQK